MNRKYMWGVIALLVAAVLLVVYVRSSKEIAVTNYHSSGTDIIAFGDSLVQGVGASSADKNFVSILSARLNQPIINLGVSGNTTADGVQRLGQLDKYNPKVVLVLLSGNDRLRQIPQEQTLANMGSIIESIQTKGAVVVVLGVRGSFFGSSFEEQLEAVAKSRGAVYVPDVLDGLFGSNSYMSDLVHPNDAGYAKIADRVYPILMEYVK